MNSRQAGIDGVHDGALKIALTARAVDNQANAALLLFLAQAFGVSQSHEPLEHGRKQRNKLVRIVKPACAPPWFGGFGGHWQAG